MEGNKQCNRGSSSDTSCKANKLYQLRLCAVNQSRVAKLLEDLLRDPVRCSHNHAVLMIHAIGGEDIAVSKESLVGAKMDHGGPSGSIPQRGRSEPTASVPFSLLHCSPMSSNLPGSLSIRQR